MGRTFLDVVAEVGSAERALAGLAVAKPQLVLMDVHLPGISGFEAARRIREIDPEVRVIVVSSDDNPRYPAQAREAGAETFILKMSLTPTVLRNIAWPDGRNFNLLF